jgi:hypothetical protein
MDKTGKKIKRNIGSGKVERVLRRKKPAEKEQPPPKAPPAHEAPPGPDNNAVSVEEEGPIDFKGQLTLKELGFLEAYLSGECSIDQAMVAAGYGNYHMRSRYRLAHKIIQKYETQAGARKALRACGVGEVRVAKKINELMEGGSERTQLGATELAAKCLGMTQDQAGPTQGVTIVIQGPDGQQAALRPAPKATPRLPAPDPHLLPPGKPIQITD